MMYQENRDISTRMMRVPLATKSPWAQRADRPYGFSTTAVGVFSIDSSIKKTPGAKARHLHHQFLSSNLILKGKQSVAGWPSIEPATYRPALASFNAPSSSRALPED